MTLHQISLVLLFLALPQAVAFGGRALFKMSGIGVCLTAGLTFFVVSFVAFIHVLGNPPTNAVEPYCGQWLAGFPLLIFVGSLVHTIFAAGILGCLFVVDTIWWWRVHGSAYLADKSGLPPE